MTDRLFTSAVLIADGLLRIEDGNHGEYRPRPHEFVEDGVAFIRAADMTSGVVDFQGAGRISSVARARIRKGIGQSGDVLLSHKGTVGRVAVVPMDAPEFVCSPQTTFWRSLDQARLDQRFLRCVLESQGVQRQLSVLMSKTDMAPYVSLTDQRTMLIPVPPISEQRAIADVLGALDDKIAANTRFAHIAGSLAEAEWLRAGRRTSETVPLREVATLNYGKALPAKRRVPGEVQVVGSGGVNGTHNEALVSEPGIVVGRKGTAGAVHWLDGPHFPIDTTYFVTPIGALTNHFLYYELKSMRLTEMNSDSAVPGLNREEAHAAPVRHPEQDSMRRFNEVVPVLFDSIAQVEVESEALATTRDALLPLLMSGKVTVKDAESVVEGVV